MRRDNEKIAPVEAIELQVAIMRNEKAPPSVRLAASMALHDRGYGKRVLRVLGYSGAAGDGAGCMWTRKSTCRWLHC